MDAGSLDAVLEQVKAGVYYGSSPEQALAKVAVLARLTPGEVKEVRAEYDRQARKYIELTDPRVLNGNARVESWYQGPDFPGAWCWPKYKEMLAQTWSPEAIRKLDESSTKILAHLSHPSKNFASRGLVVGYVQSGKTANYSALISKAADVGYKLFIVLSGITSSLRQQTQKRLEKDIVSRNPQNWSTITGPERDFGYYPGVVTSLLNPANKHGRVLGVVKKNKQILQSLKAFLQKAGPAILAGCPVIVIDDEADNASINTRKEDRTAINRLIIEILGCLPKAAYVGYTATPFANVFIDPARPEDLFPRDFIFDLPRPQGYFGAEKIFGRDLLWFDTEEKSFEGLDIIRTVTKEEQQEIQPKKAADRGVFEPEIPESLEKAIAYFFLSTACRYARGQDAHSSMLVHTTQYVILHQKLKVRVAELVSDFKVNWKRRKSALRELWESECAYTSGMEEGAVDFDEVASKLPEVLDRCEVIVDNMYQASRLVYPDEGKAKVYIAIGGNTLSRGLTLEGLIVSYFVRVASAYDTLLQMGRWFGYRFGYSDLPRIWMTDELEEYFFFLSEIEEEIRHDIERLEKQGKSPRDLAIRVRTHPKLQITAKNKMGAARLASASYSDQRLQSFIFKHRDAPWLGANLEAGRTLLRGLSATRKPEVRGSAQIFRDVSANDVLKFLSSYAFHEDHEELRRDLLANYITKERTKQALESWNVAVIGREEASSELGQIDLGLGTPVPCISRSRFRWTEPCNIKALTSADDRIVDLERPSGKLDENGMIALRNAKAAGKGLLLLYPISKHSTPAYPGAKPRPAKEFCEICKQEHLKAPKGKKSQRHPLLAFDHVLGAALVFPKSAVGDENYMALDLASVFERDPDEVDPDVEGQAASEEEIAS